MPLLGDDIVEDVEHMQDDNTATITDVQDPLSPTVSQAPSSSRATHSSGFTASL